MEGSTALEDASLDLSAYCQSIEDLATCLRTHDGLELEDFLSYLAAHHQALEDVGSDFSAYFQSLENASASLQACAYSKEDIRTFIQAAALVLEDVKTHLSALGDAREDLAAYFHAAGYAKNDLSTYLAAATPLVLSDLGVCFETTDGLSFSCIGVYLTAVKRAPSFRSVIAQRVSSVVQEV